MTKYAVFSRGHNKDDIKHGDGTMDKDVDIHERYSIAVTSLIASESDLNCLYHEIWMETLKNSQILNFSNQKIFFFLGGGGVQLIPCFKE